MKPYLIGITGGSGSGKTTFIKRLRERFPDRDVCIVSQDDYYLPREEQYTDEKGWKHFDLPKSFDKKAFRRDIEKLMSGAPVTLKEYVYNNENATPQEFVIKPAPILIVEGLFVFHFKKIAPLFDLKVFVSTKENLKVIRRILRDQVERNYPIEDVLYRYEHHVLPSYEKYIEPYRENADIVINNNHNFNAGLDVLSGFIKAKLMEKASV